MTHTKDEALKLALEALDSMRIVDFSVENLVGWNKAITAIKQALAAQPAPVPLTDEQIDAEFEVFASKFDHESNEWLDMGVDEYFRAGFRAAPLAAQPAPVQESVAGVVLRDGYPTLVQDKHIKENDKRLYTTPPAAQRQWVGLTDAEKLDIEIMGGKSDVMLAEMVEAKLMGRNT